MDEKCKKGNYVRSKVSTPDDVHNYWSRDMEVMLDQTYREILDVQELDGDCKKVGL